MDDAYLSEDHGRFTLNAEVMEYELSNQGQLDRFAGIALSRMHLSVPCAKQGYIDQMADACYEYAEAMMRARERNKGP